MPKTNTLLFLILILLSVFLSSCSPSKKTINHAFSVKNHTLIRPNNLKIGDTVAIISPAGHVKEDYVLKAIALLDSWGLKVKLGKNLYKKEFTYSGSKSERIEDLQTALDDPNTKAIWCARGGYGSIQIIDAINWKGFAKNPKWVLGFSDITVLLSALHNQGYESMHALMPISLSTDRPIKRKQAITSVKKALFGEALSYTIPSSKYNRAGVSTGEVVGGNLATLYSLLQSNLTLDTTGKIIYLEEVGEYHYAVDRMLISLRRAGYFDKCKGLIIGGMNMKEDDPEYGKTVEEIILEITKDFNFPILFNFPAGHIIDNRVVLIGRKANIKIESKITSVKFDL